MGYRSQFLLENMAILLFITIGFAWFLILQVIRLTGFKKDSIVRLLSVFTWVNTIIFVRVVYLPFCMATMMSVYHYHIREEEHTVTNIVLSSVGGFALLSIPIKIAHFYGTFVKETVFEVDS
jgi:hypothetical protein